MAASTGPILAIGAITVANESIVNGQPVDWRVVIATGLAALAFSGLESASASLAPAIGHVAWLALLTTLIVSLKPGIPSPAASFFAWYNKK